MKNYLSGIDQLKALTLLNLEDNNLNTLPDDLKSLQELQVINLRKNSFKHTPEVFIHFPNLREVDLANNQLDLVKSMKTLKEIKKLDFLYLSGNEISLTS